LMPYLQKAPQLYQKTILKDSDGKIPPYCVCMGDHRRVKALTKLFDEGSASILSNLMMENGANPGRVCVAVGTYKGTPIVAFEHQMGSSGAEILIREMISNTVMTNEFKLGATTFKADAKYLIRIGSAAGINCYQTADGKALKSPQIEAYDVIVASHQVGISCADYSALTGSLNALIRSKEETEKVGKMLSDMGYEMKKGWPVLPLDKSVMDLLKSNIETQLKERNQRFRSTEDVKLGSVYALGNVSKDSLYAETEEEAFTDLRAKLDVGCSEMEFGTISRCGAHKTLLGDKVKTGMAACVLGSIPGDSFAEIDKTVSGMVTDSALVGALETLHAIAEGHKQG